MGVCAEIEIKESRAAIMPFHRTKVRLKKEIVTMGQPDLDPLAGVGTYVAPEEWNALISDPETIVIDTRNDYEVSIGSFAGAINPMTGTFRDFPEWYARERERLLGSASPPKVAMFCTGGIRCEKATAFVKQQGLEEVYHLEGGILAYLEQIEAAQSRWDEGVAEMSALFWRSRLNLPARLMMLACEGPDNVGRSNLKFVNRVRPQGRK